MKMKKLLLLLFSILFLWFSFAYNEVETQVLTITNIIREAWGLWTVVSSPLLYKIAKDQCIYMEKSWEYSHYRSDWTTPEDRFNPIMRKYSKKTTRRWENLARWYYAAVDVVVARWNSPTHKEVMMNPIYTKLWVYHKNWYTCEAWSN